VGHSLGDRGFTDVGSYFSGNLPLGGIHHDGNVWRPFENGGGGFFFRSRDSDSFGGIDPKFFSTVEGFGDARSGRLVAFGVGFRGFGSDGLSRCAVALGLHPDENLQSFRMVSDRVGTGLVGAG